jgi:hypothetical protein
MKLYLMVILFLFGLSISGFAQKTKNTTSSCTAFPCVVATISVVNQSTNVTQAPIYTPTEDGTFRINAYMSTSPDDNVSAYWKVVFAWTDELGLKFGGILTPHQNAYYPMTIVVNDVAGQPLAYSVRPHSGNGGGGSHMTYDLTIVVEQLR